MTVSCIAVLAVVLIPNSAGFPARPTQALTMVDVHVSALSQNEKRSVISLAQSETEGHRCSNPVLVAQPVLAPRHKVIIINGCESSATGNALFWIALEGRSGVQVLASSNHVQQIYVLKSATNGFRDIVVTTHESAFWSDLRLIQYDGHEYTLRHCAERVYDEDAVSAPPTITPVKCSEFGELPKTSPKG